MWRGQNSSWALINVPWRNAKQVSSFVWEAPQRQQRYQVTRHLASVFIEWQVLFIASALTPDFCQASEQPLPLLVSIAPPVGQVFGSYVLYRSLAHGTVKHVNWHMWRGGGREREREGSGEGSGQTSPTFFTYSRGSTSRHPIPSDATASLKHWEATK